MDLSHTSPATLSHLDTPEFCPQEHLSLSLSCASPDISTTRCSECEHPFGDLQNVASDKRCLVEIEP